MTSPVQTPGAAPPARSTGRAGPRRPIVRVAVAVVAVLLVGELAARALAPHLPPATIGDEPEMQVKREQMRALAAAAAPTDVVVLGNSVGDGGLDPSVLLETRPDLGTAYNASLVGAPLVGQATWARRFALPLLQPDTVVLVISPIDGLAVNPLDLLTAGAAGAADRAAVEASFLAALDRLEPGPLARVEDRVADVSQLVAHRSTLRHPHDVGRAAGDLFTGQPAREGLAQTATEGGVTVARDEAFWRRRLTAQGFATDEVRRLGGKPDPRILDLLRSVLTFGTTSSSEIDTLLETVAGTDGARGDRNVVVVIPPLANQWLEQAGIDRTASDRAARVISERATLVGATVVDLSQQPFPTELYTDAVHLNADGSRRLTELVAAELP